MAAFGARDCLKSARTGHLSSENAFCIAVIRLAAFRGATSGQRRSTRHRWCRTGAARERLALYGQNPYNGVTMCLTQNGFHGKSLWLSASRYMNSCLLIRC